MGKGAEILKREHTLGSLSSGFLICFLKVGILEAVSGEDLHRIFISFSGMSINTLIHQNEHMEGSSFYGQFHLQRMSPKRG